MKSCKTLIALALTLCVTASPFVSLAADAPKKPKPYALKTCAVTGEKLGGMGEPYTFTHEGREIKLCCKGCLKEFKKDPAKYIKKVEAAEAKAAKKAS